MKFLVKNLTDAKIRVETYDLAPEAEWEVVRDNLYVWPSPVGPPATLGYVAVKATNDTERKRRTKPGWGVPRILEPGEEAEYTSNGADPRVSIDTVEINEILPN